MVATPQQTRHVFDEWHRAIQARDAAGLAAPYTDDALLESPLVPRVLDDPRQNPDGDQLDLVEVMELAGARIRRHRIYWGWCGTEHIKAYALEKATAN